MNGITHKQAQRYLRMDLDGLLSEAQRLDLETHLRACEACRLDSESFSKLTRRLQAEFHSRWDGQDGPSQNVLTNIRAKSRRIMMQKRIDFAFNIFGGIVALFVLVFVVSSVVSQFQKKSTTANGTQTNVPASSNEERLIAFTSAQDGNPEIYIMRADGSNLTNLTNNPADDTNPVWSPNGKQIAFTSNRNDADISQIYLMDADGSKVTLLTKKRVDHILPSALNNKSSLWSPDGNKLLYLQYRYDTDWNLQSIDVNNGNTTYLGTGRFDLNNISWSPNGRYIAYLKNDPQNTDENSYLPDLYVVNADGSNPREIKKLIPVDGRLFDYRWSKDSDSILFMGYKDNPFSIETIYEFNLNTNSLIQNFTLTTGAIDWHDGISLIHPSAKETTFVWQRPDGTSNSLPWGAACSEFNFGRSSSGNFIIGAVCPDQKSGFYWANSDGSIIKKLLTIGDMTRVSGWVHWSPDDQYLATTVVTPKNTSLYILNVEASLKNPSIQPVVVSVADEESFTPIAWQPMIWEDLTETQPTPGPEKNSSPERLLAFTSRQSGNSEIYTVRSDGGDVRNITNNPAQDVNPFWSPDGKHIAFQSDRTNGGYYSQIFLMDADGANVVLLTTEKGNHELPLNIYDKTNPWSPDGSKLLFLRQGLSEGEWILQSIDINKGGITSLASGRFFFSDISWSPDGKYIGFVLHDPQNTALGKIVPELHVVSADGSNLININSLLPSNETLDNNYYYWSRDGESISFIASNMAPENTARENYTWKLYEASIDGSLTLQATTRSPIGGWWDGNYFIIAIAGSGGWTWMHPDGSFNTINPTKECEQERLYDASTNSYTSAVANFSQSPNGNGVIIASCPDGNVHVSWVNSTGTEITPIAKLSTAPVVGYLDWAHWSMDGKFIAFCLTATNPTDVYLVNITESLKNPSIPPVKISLDRSVFPFRSAWQPVP